MTNASSKTKPKPPLRASERRVKRQQMLRRQSYFRTSALLIIIALTWLVDYFWIRSGLLVTKGIALGAGLNWLAQSLFAWFVFRFSGAQAQQNIAYQLYIGQLIKWVVVIVGFMLIYSLMQPIAAGAVIAGFIAMQLINIVLVWRLR